MNTDGDKKMMDILVKGMSLADFVCKKLDFAETIIPVLMVLRLEYDETKR